MEHENGQLIDEVSLGIQANTTTRLAFRANYFISPFDYFTLAGVFSVLGYTMDGPKQPRQPSIRAETDGPIGQKGIFTADCNTVKQVVGVSAIKAESVAAEFETLVKVLNNNFSDFSSKVSFYELMFQGQYKTEKSPLKVISSFKKESPLCKEISDILGFDVSPFGLKFASTTGGLESEEWADYDIQPFIPRANELYMVSATFRSKSLENVLKYTNNIETSTIKVLQQLESKSATLS